MTNEKQTGQPKVEPTAAPEKPALGVDNTVAHPDPVELSAVLNEIESTEKEHIIIDEDEATAVTLWIALTYFLDDIEIMPLLFINAPEKACGKTQLLTLVGDMVKNPMPVANMTPASLFRSIEKWQPTLLIDEADTFIHNNKVLRGIINSSHAKSHARVLRSSAGKDGTPKSFSTWVSMVIGMIGMPPDTITDRSLVIQLQRKLPSESTKRISLDFDKECHQICQKIVRWTEDNSDQLKQLQPTLPNSHNDREIDNWAPLFVIAETIGPNWHEQALKAYSSLSKPDDESIGVLLLSDIQEVFEEKDRETIHSNDLINYLITSDESPWLEFRGGRTLTATALANILKPFGIKSKQMRIGALNRNGYSIDMFKDAFSRYIPAPITQTSTTLQSTNTDQHKEDDKLSNTKTVESTLPMNTITDVECSVVEDKTPPKSNKNKKRRDKKKR